MAENPRISRVVAAVFTFAVVGMVATVGTAWCMALREARTHPHPETPVENIRYGGVVWENGRFQVWPDRWTRRETLSVHRTDANSPRAMVLYRDRCGFPFRSMEARHVEWVTPMTRDVIERKGLAIPKGWTTGASKPAGFPTVPLWPQFAANTAFYGTLALLLWSAPGFVRKTRRRRRGLCAHCGYELKGMQKCSECGGETEPTASPGPLRRSPSS